MSDLLLRYHELLAFRREALTKYRCNELTVIGGPPAKAYAPILTTTPDPDPRAMRMRLGPFCVVDRPPLARFAERLAGEFERPITVVEAGPGDGRLAKRLRDLYGDRIAAYYGIELDPNVEGPYQRVASVGEIDRPIDLFIASEVAEHMPAQRWYADFLQPLSPRMSPDGKAIVSVPNPVGPGTYVRDFSHVQPYPWYDMYAIMRLAFQEASVQRALYLWSLQRILTLVPRFVLCSAIELDWCDNIICIASKPRG